MVKLIQWFVANADWLVPAIIAYATVTESLPFLPTKANGVLHALVEILKRTKWGATAAVCVFLLAGCTTLNVSMNSTAGDNNKPAIRTDADAKQDISGKANVPVQGGTVNDGQPGAVFK